jgi:hypothetical protein
MHDRQRLFLLLYLDLIPCQLDELFAGGADSIALGLVKSRKLFLENRVT